MGERLGGVQYSAGRGRAHRRAPRRRAHPMRRRPPRRRMPPPRVRAPPRRPRTLPHHVRAATGGAFLTA